MSRGRARRYIHSHGALLLPFSEVVVVLVLNAVRSVSVVLVAVVASGCLSAVEELGEPPVSAREAATAAAATSTCGGSPVRITDVATASARFQGRWQQCGAISGRVNETPAFVHDVVAFEVVGDEWFALQQDADGTWRRLDDVDHRGALSWWAMGNVGVSFELGGTGWLPAIVAFSTGGVRLDLYPGVQVDYVPLP